MNWMKSALGIYTGSAPNPRTWWDNLSDKIKGSVVGGEDGSLKIAFMNALGIYTGSAPNPRTWWDNLSDKIKGSVVGGEDGSLKSDGSFEKFIKAIFKLPSSPPTTLPLILSDKLSHQVLGFGAEPV